MVQGQVFGYADRLHVRSGEAINFKISSEGNIYFDASLVRVVNGCIDSTDNRFQEVAIACEFEGQYEGREKKVYPGSYAAVSLETAFARSASHTIQLFFCPTVLFHKSRQTVAFLQGQWEEEIEIWVEGNNLFARLKGQGGACNLRIEGGLKEKRWHLLALSWSASRSSARFRLWRFENHFHKRARTTMFEDSARCQPPFFQGGADLFLAAKVAGPDGNGQSVVGNCFDGKLDALRIANAVLESEEVMAATAFDPDQSVRDRLLGVFNFSNWTLGSFRNELPPHQTGTLANMPRLGVTGARWDGSVHNFSEAPEHYSAVHFHSDDLYDCGWSSDFTFTISETLKSGIYAAKVVNVEGAMDYVPFFVMPRKCASRRAAIALMLPTMTYLAYANERIDDNSQQFGFDVEKWATQFEPDLGGYAKLCSHPEFGMSLYDFHKDGLGRHFSSWLRPMLNMRPKAAIWGMPADTLIASWLEHCGFEFDVITDHAVHEEGVDLLAGYSTVISGNHPEYVTSQILDAIEDYTQDCGGRFIYMGGNGYYWVTGVHESYPAAIEVRRGVGGSGAWFSPPGEHYLQSTRELGGLWRHVGRPPQQVFGVGTRGMGFQGSTYFARSADWDNLRVRFLTERVDEEPLGDYGLLGGGAAGEEIDAVDGNLGTPSHALVIASSQNHPRGMMIAREDLRFVVPDEWVHSRVRADIVFFETPSGGAVLSFSSMTWCGSLSHNNYDNGVSRLSENAVRRFIDPTPFEIPELL